MSHCFHNCNLVLCSVPFIMDSSSLALCLEKLMTIQYLQACSAGYMGSGEGE